MVGVVVSLGVVVLGSGVVALGSGMVVVRPSSAVENESFRY